MALCQLMFIVCFCTSNDAIDNSQSITPTDNNTLKLLSLTMTLPTSDATMAVCHFNDTFYLFGGYIHPTESFQYNIENGVIANNTLPRPTYGLSQYYLQINSRCYWISETNHIIIYNMQTNQFEQNITITQFEPDTQGCLATNNDLLFVLGGVIDAVYIKSVQVYNISSQTWLTQIPPMSVARGDFSCIVDTISNELYAIGGRSYNDAFAYTNKIDKIVINNMSQQQWISIDDLLTGAQYTRAIMHGHRILVIGGFYYEMQKITNSVQAIDCATGTISIVGNLTYPVQGAATIKVNDIIYVFGGQVSTDQYGELGTGNYTNKWQYLNITSMESTETEADVKHSGQLIWIIVVTIGVGCIILTVIAFVLVRRWHLSQRDELNQDHMWYQELNQTVAK